MQDNYNPEMEEALRKWIKQQLDSGVQDLMDKGLYNSITIEAKPAWVFPFGILIGMAREQDQRSGFDWFISGDFPTDHVHSTVAETARDAARHFVLQWQLAAKRQEVGSDGDGSTNENAPEPDETLVERAQSLYELVEQDELWS